MNQNDMDKFDEVIALVVLERALTMPNTDESAIIIADMVNLAYETAHAEGVNAGLEWLREQVTTN